MAQEDDDPFLLRVAQRGGRFFEKLPRQIAGQYKELGAQLGDVARWNPATASTMAAYDALNRQLQEKEIASRGGETVVTPGPWAQTFKDPTMQVAGGIADPLNWVGAGVIGGAKKGVKALTEAVKKPRGIINVDLRSVPPAEAAAIAGREEHLIPATTSSEGKYVGGPRNITTRAQLAANRRRMDVGLGESAREIEAAGEKVGDWYPSQQRGIAVTTEPWQQQYLPKIHAEVSPVATPENERAFANTAWNRIMRGEPAGVVHTGAQGRRIEAGVKGTRPMAEGKKIKQYGVLSDPNLPLDDPRRIFGTNDYREAQFQGYTEPSGKPQQAGMNPQQHVFMDAETLLRVKRANEKLLGGRQDWSGSMVQETPWITSKADYFQKKYPKRFPKTQEGRNAAIQEASKTAEDYLTKQAAGATYERVPGTTTGHDPEILKGTFAEQRAYGAAAPWTDPASKDVIYKSQRSMQLPTQETVGMWEGKASPGYMAPVQADLVASGKTTGKIPKGIELSPEMRRQLRSGEMFRGVMDVQEFGGYNQPLEHAVRKGRTKTHGLIKHETPLTESEARALGENLPKGYSASATPQGTWLMQWDKPSGAVKKDIDLLNETLGQGQLPVTRVGMESELVPAWARQAQGGTALTPPEGRKIPIKPGTGVITKRLIRELSRAPAETTRGMAESDELRRHVNQLIKRDVGRAETGHAISAPAQKTREFFGGETRSRGSRPADWNAVVELLRKNPRMKVSAAMAAALGPGYSLSGMAEERPR